MRKRTENDCIFQSDQSSSDLVRDVLSALHLGIGSECDAYGIEVEGISFGFVGQETREKQPSGD